MKCRQSTSVPLGQPLHHAAALFTSVVSPPRCCRKPLLSCACASVVVVIVFTAGFAIAAPFEYSSTALRGPHNWPQFALNGTAWSTCAGQQQSPIDLSIVTAPDTSLPPLNLDRLSASFSSLGLQNDGVQLEMYFDLLPVSVDAPRFQFFDPLDAVSPSTPFELWKASLHLPAEHILDGARRDLEIHWVFRRTLVVGRTSTSSTLVVVTTYVAAAYGAQIELGRVLQAEKFPSPPPASASFNAFNRGTISWPQRGDDGQALFFNPLKLFPVSRNYVTYLGSLTVPPCSEGVRYYVMEEAGRVSEAQLAHLASLLSIYTPPDTEKVAVGNARPLQPLGTRLPRWFVDGVGAGQTAVPPIKYVNYGSSAESQRQSIAALVTGGLALLIAALLVPRNLRKVTHVDGGGTGPNGGISSISAAAQKYKK